MASSAPDSPQPTDSPPRSRLSIGRKLLFAAILSLTAFLLLLVTLELVLRLAGYGHSSDFARREKMPDGSVVWRENRDCTVPFFSEKLVRRPQPFRLSTTKSPGAIRIVVLGSSAAMGDPEASFSISRLLEAQLQAAYPDKQFEVINAAITAINSHVVRGIAEDCARHLQPDLFIVYEGHNEVIGPFGPTGVFTGFLRSERAIRLAIWLKSTRTGQLLSSLSRASSSPEKWGGMEMFLQQQIPADDPRLAIVRAHFSANLRAIIASADRAGASTLVCTTLANQRDFAPFLSLHRPDLPPAQQAEWEKNYAAVKGISQQAAAESACRAALAIDDRHAELHFRLARLLLTSGRETEASRHFQNALDLDALRFRADSALNDIIRALPGTLPPNSAVRVVDLASPSAAPARLGRPPGNKLLYEHVHLTFAGTSAVVEELFPAVVAELSRRSLLPVSSSQPAPPLDVNELRQRLAFTAYEQALIFLELQNRFQRPPFTAQSDHTFRVETLAKQLTTAQALLDRTDATAALRAAYEHALTLAPDDWILHRNFGMMLLARGLPADALPQLEKAAGWIDDDIDTLIALARCHRALAHSAEADRIASRVHALEPRHPELP